MKRILFALTLIFASSFIAVAQEKFGTVYLYRGADTTSYGNEVVINPDPILYLDGKEFLSLSERTFIGFKLPVGQYMLQMQQKGVSRRLDIQADRVYYFRIIKQARPNPAQIILGIDERGALEAIRKCDALKEKKVKLKEIELIRTNPNSNKKS